MSALETRLNRAARRNRNLVLHRGSDCRQSLRRLDKKGPSGPVERREASLMELVAAPIYTMENEEAFFATGLDNTDDTAYENVFFTRERCELSTHVDLSRTEAIMANARFTPTGCFIMA